MPGGARGSQEEPGGARGSQGEPGRARGSQEEPGCCSTRAPEAVLPEAPEAPTRALLGLLQAAGCSTKAPEGQAGAPVPDPVRGVQ